MASLADRVRSSASHCIHPPTCGQRSCARAAAAAFRSFGTPIHRHHAARGAGSIPRFTSASFPSMKNAPWSPGERRARAMPTHIRATPWGPQLRNCGICPCPRHGRASRPRPSPATQWRRVSRPGARLPTAPRSVLPADTQAPHRWRSAKLHSYVTVECAAVVAPVNGRPVVGSAPLPRDQPAVPGESMAVCQTPQLRNCGMRSGRRPSQRAASRGLCPFAARSAWCARRIDGSLPNSTVA